MQLRLTKRAIDSLPEPEPGSRYTVHDTALRGLILTVSAGRKVFAVRYGDRRRRRLLTLGTYGEITLEDAQKKCKAVLGDVAKGLDPATAHHDQKRVPTFDAWCDEYEADAARRLKSHKQVVWFLRPARERFGRKLLTEVTTDDVRKLFETVAAAGTLTKANRVLAHCRAALAAAWRADLVPANVALKVRALPEPAPRDRVLSGEELERLGRAISQLEDEYAKAALVLLLVTGARCGEVLRCEWAHVDLDAAMWRLPDSKSGRAQTIPLPPPAVAVLDGLKRVGRYVVLGRDPERPRVDLKGPWNAVRAAAGLEDANLHDLRRTFGLALSQEAGLHVASKLLRHSSILVTERHYAPLGLDELAKASTKHSRALARVIKFPKKKAASGSE